MNQEFNSYRSIDNGWNVIVSLLSIHKIEDDLAYCQQYGVLFLSVLPKKN